VKLPAHDGDVGLECVGDLFVGHLFLDGEDPAGSLSPGQLGKGKAQIPPQLFLVQALLGLVLGRGW